MEIPYGSTLAEIVWKFYRICLAAGVGTPRNSHFYSWTAFDEEVITRVPPLGDWNAKEDSRRLPERVFVHVDDENGRIRLSSEDETITRLYAAVFRWLVQPITLFKGLLVSWSKSPWDHSLIITWLHRYRGESTG